MFTVNPEVVVVNMSGTATVGVVARSFFLETRVIDALRVRTFVVHHI